MAADPSILALQQTINRFAKAGGFAAISADGVFGSQTKQGVYNALGWISKASTVEQPFRDSATGYVASWDGKTGAQLSLIAFFLGNVANSLHLNTASGTAVATGGGSGPSVQITPTGGGAAAGGGQITLPIPAAATAAGLFGMPKWLTYVGGGGLALVVLMLVAKRKKKPSGVSGQDIRCVRREGGRCVEWSWR
jgi:hypothetical protein